MPYVHMSIAKKLTDNQKEAIKASIGQLIEILPGKSEKVLMIRMDDDVQMVFRGVPSACAYVNVNLYLMSPDNKKAEFAQALVQRAANAQPITQAAHAEMTRQLTGHQQLLTERFLKAPFHEQRHGNYRVPVPDDALARCWGSGRDAGWSSVGRPC